MKVLSVPSVELPEIVCVLAVDRPSLLQVCDDYALRRGVPLEALPVYLLCELPCGTARAYVTRSDVPLVDDACACDRLGQPHYFIKYRVQEA